jgi:hypothetical protein
MLNRKPLSSQSAKKRLQRAKTQGENAPRNCSCKTTFFSFSSRQNFSNYSEPKFLRSFLKIAIILPPKLQF